MLKMLVGNPAPSVDGTTVQLQAQVSALLWKIDDLLLTTRHSNGETRRLALSVKGNVQVSAKGLPTDFVQRAWAQWRDPGSPMDKARDVMALATYGRHADFDASWREVKAACQGADTALAVARIRESKAQLKVFDSVKKAADSEVEASDEETIALVRHLDVLPFDFQSPSSEHQSQAIGLSRGALVSGELGEATRLWADLVKVATKVRIEQGTLTVQQLVEALRRTYALVAHPDYRGDWEILDGLTRDARARVEEALPTGRKLDRETSRRQIQAAILANHTVLVSGDSGCGKSALVKSVLDEQFTDFRQIWLSPETFSDVTTLRGRGVLSLRHELKTTLAMSTHAKNVLVLDSAERIKVSDEGVVRAIIGGLTAPIGGVHSWRVVVISQSRSGAAPIHAALSSQVPNLVEVGALSVTEVQFALSSVPSLSWMSAHQETAAALTNLKTLAWVMKAGDGLGLVQGKPISHVEVAERLWEHWTANRETVKALMMRLAQREASFERSFALTSLGADLVTFEQRPPELPLVMNSRRNRVEFAHDLAADWARYQVLKQDEGGVQGWSSLASNPLWTNALRMMGQLLLRESAADGTQWDLEFKNAEAAGLTSVQDLLLDALVLDSNAARFLAERADFLFANNARYLTRLLTRFLHIATVPKTGFSGIASVAGVLMEANMRTIVFARWPAMIVFLVNHRDRVGDMTLPALARVLQMWLIEGPKTNHLGQPFPLRLELAQLALVMARTIQVGMEYGTGYAGFSSELFTAALSGAHDAPDEVAQFALEMAGRKDPSDSVLERVSERRLDSARKHNERLKTDVSYKEDHERRLAQRKSIPITLSSFERRLPPWPLGAQRRVEHRFREVCFEHSGLTALMSARPEVASEVLLALLIEDDPKEPDYNNRDPEDELGLEFPQTGVVNALWSSPFMAFFVIAPEVATRTLIALVNFATERWATAGRRRGAIVPQVDIESSSGTRSFIGGGTVAGWSYSNGMRLRDLTRAMNCFEWWIRHQLKSDKPVESLLELVLTEGRSTALLGVLSSIGKAKPSLFSGVLWPLLSTPKTIFWDEDRVEMLRAYPELFSLSETSADMQEERGTLLKDLLAERLTSDRDFAERLREETAKWPVPIDEKARLNHRSMLAELDIDNYRDAGQGADGGGLVYVRPLDVESELREHIVQASKAIEYSRIPSTCMDWLDSRRLLREGVAEKVYEILQKCINDDELESDEKEHCTLALVSVLLVLAQDWLGTSKDAHACVLRLLDEFVAKAEATDEDEFGGRGEWRLKEQVQFASIASTYLWARSDRRDSRREREVIVLMTSGRHGNKAVFQEAYRHHQQLGDAWWRLLRIGVLWSGLSMLQPRRHTEDAEVRHLRWRSWLTRLRGFRVRGVPTSEQDLQFNGVAAGVARLDFAQRMRAYHANEPLFGIPPKRRYLDGLHTGLLGESFKWLVDGDGTGDWRCDVALALRLWDYVIGRSRARPKDNGEYDILGQGLGYEVIVKLVSLSLSAPAGLSRSVWEPVLKHGPAAHHVLQHYFTCFYLHAKQTQDRGQVARVWKETAEWVLNADWKNPRFWYHREQLTCTALGFVRSSLLENALDPATVLTLKPVYEAWAKDRLHVTEDNVVRFSGFLATGFGAPIRADGLQWISAAFASHSDLKGWYRDDLPNALVALVGTVVSDDEATLLKNEGMREALIAITALLAERHVSAAYALQERIRSLNRKG